MQGDFVILIVVVIFGFGVLAWILTRKKDDATLTEWLKSMQSSIDHTNTDVAKLLQSNAKQLNERLDTAARVIGDLKKNLGEMSEVGKGIRSLQEFLQSPKLRGNIGEQVLQD